MAELSLHQYFHVLDNREYYPKRIVISGVKVITVAVNDLLLEIIQKELKNLLPDNLKMTRISVKKGISTFIISKK